MILRPHAFRARSMSSFAYGAVAVAVLSGCTSSIQVPLCGDLARTTYRTVPVESSEISSYTRSVAADLNLKLEILSPFVMRVSGLDSRVAKFMEDYPTMLCGFDPVQVTVPHDTYLSCTSHAKKWIDVVQAGKPEDLMLQNMIYEPICASGVAKKPTVEFTPNPAGRPST